MKTSNDIWKYKQIEEAVKKHKRLGEETKQKIFLLILESEPDGMTTNELVKTTGRDRRTIHGICRNYIKKGLINEKSGIYEKYHLSSNAMHTDDPAIGSLLLQYRLIRTQLFALGEVAFSSSMDFFDAEYFQRILNSKHSLSNIEQKESLEKFYFFEFALRLGASILYILIQSMKYANPSLHISESMRNQLITRRFETAVNPILLKTTFELLLSFLEQRLWKEYDIPLQPPLSPPENEKMESVNEKLLKEWDEKMETFRKKLLEEKFEEMESIYKKTFPFAFELIEKLQYDMVYEPSVLAVEKDEQEDPKHVKCGGELMSGIYVDPDGRRVKKCLRCKRLIPVEDSKPYDL